MVLHSLNISYQYWRNIEKMSAPNTGAIFHNECNIGSNYSRHCSRGFVMKYNFHIVWKWNKIFIKFDLRKINGNNIHITHTYIHWRNFKTNNLINDDDKKKNLVFIFIYIYIFSIYQKYSYTFYNRYSYFSWNHQVYLRMMNC